MIVRVGLVRRALRSLPPLDYRVPDDLVKHIKPGQLVTLPLKTSHTYGIIFSIHETAQIAGLKSLLTIEHEEPLLGPLQLHLARLVSRWYGTSVHSATKLLMLPMQKRKLKQLTLFPLKKPKRGDFEESNYIYESSDDRIAFLKSVAEKPGETLILLPSLGELEHVANALRREGVPLMVWHGRLSQKSQFEGWLSIRNGAHSCILATRSGIFLPLQQLKRIVIDYAHDELGHKQWEGTPRFSAPDLARVTAQALGIRLIHSSFIPRLADVASDERMMDRVPSIRPVIIDIQSQRAAKDFSPLSQRALSELRQAKTAFVLLNRRGYARSLRCLQCGHVESCESCAVPLAYHKKQNQLRCHSCQVIKPTTVACPQCQDEWLKLRGYGTQYLEEQLSGLFPAATITRVDADTADDDIPQGGIFVGTNRLLSLVRELQPDVVVYVDIDADLAVPEFAHSMDLFYQVHQLFAIQPDVTCLLQTRSPGHPFFQGFADASSFLREQLRIRSALQYPPYSELVRLGISGPSPDAASARATVLAKHLQTLLTKRGSEATLTHPFALHPRYARGAFWYGILAKLPATQWENELLWLNRYIPADVQIDPSPQRILST